MTQASQPALHVGAAVGLALGAWLGLVGLVVGLVVGSSVEHAQLRPNDAQIALEAPLRIHSSQLGSPALRVGRTHINRVLSFCGTASEAM